MTNLNLKMAGCALLLSMSCANLDNLSITRTGKTLIKKNPTEIDFGVLEFSNLSEIDLNQIASDNGRQLEDIDSIKINSAILDLPFPQNANFDFAESIEFFVQADGVAPLKIASISPVPRNTKEITLDVAAVDLLNFSESRILEITSRLVGTTPEFDTEVQATIDLEVDVDVTDAAGCNG